MRKILQSFSFKRAFMAGAGLCVALALYFEIGFPVIWNIFGWPLYQTSPQAATALFYAMEILACLLILAVPVSYYFSNEKVDLIQSVLLGVVFVTCVYILGWIQNQYETLMDPDGYRHVGNLAVWEMLVIIVATVVVTAIIRYFRPSIFSSEGREMRMF